MILPVIIKPCKVVIKSRCTWIGGVIEWKVHALPSYEAMCSMIHLLNACRLGLN